MHFAARNKRIRIRMQGGANRRRGGGGARLGFCGGAVAGGADKGEEAGNRATEAESEAGEGGGNCPWLIGAVAEAEAVMIAGMTWRWRSTIAVRNSTHTHVSSSRASSTCRYNDDWFGPARFIQTLNPALSWLGQGPLEPNQTCFRRASPAAPWAQRVQRPSLNPFFFFFFFLLYSSSIRHLDVKIGSQRFNLVRV